MQVQSGALTDVGQKRKRNEDFLVSDDDLGLFVVIDGMGGHARGDVASRLIGEAIRAVVAETVHGSQKTWPFEFDPRLSYSANRMKIAVTVANSRLAQRVSEDEQLRGMGATMAGALIDGDTVVISHVGDCRTYLIRDRAIRQVTSDHSWVAEQVRNGLIDEADAKRHPLRNVVTRAISGAEYLEVDVLELRLAAGDRLLLCSDGLHGLASDEDLLRNTTAGGPQVACEALVAMANERGGPDNITAIVVAVSE
jgi:PPM family protein phosphatase